MRRAISGSIALGLFLLSGNGAMAQMDLVLSGQTVAIPVRSLRDIPFRSVVRQQFDYSCGSAAVATLLTYHYGLPTSETDAFKAMYEVGDQAQIQKVGFSLLDIKKYLEARGMRANGFRVTLDEVAGVGVPVITVITLKSYKHFVVIKGISDREVLIGDPAMGLHRVPRAEFETMWNGIIFAIEDSNTPPLFNASAEWRPWTAPPVGSAVDNTFLATINANPPTIYQIVQATNLSAVP